ncbi:NAD-dependent epimerase/dehydratase family protein [Phreatobacter sp. AB_2022a]|uniref:NAD-dependent epimerase/dehydratase family protein n=1 Tax=Phreatobacter sp. AB_2022a TaxID=3003134 RepID=UPI002286F088|nr:NAD(P)-dependent oxidoreductase [Phreatobacter sp. AB_2022a]MCZ0738045.1 NAD(P)-dependent oxidoreductase [Phreatobacter sp. AB_2022a]
MGNGRPPVVLVAGGRGFVGSHVVRALVHAGYRPVLFGPAMAEDRLADLAGRYDEVIGSVEDRAGLAAAFAAARPKAVVSCVAHGVGRLGLMRSGETEADAAFAVNVSGHGRLIEAAHAAGVGRIVWTSSTVVYGPAELYGGRLVDEDDRAAPTTTYGLTKQLAEAVAAFHGRRHGLAVVGLRLPLILGPGLWYQGAASAIAALFEAARAGRPATIAFHDAAVDLMHVTDVAQAIVTVLGHDGALDPVYNLKGFEASLPALIAAVERRVPAARIAFERVAPALLFPLIDGRRLAAATGFAARYDLDGLVEDLLSTASEP